MEVVRTSETLVYYNKATWCNIPEGSNLHTRHHENLKSIFKLGLGIIIIGLFPAVKVFCTTGPKKLGATCFSFFENEECKPSSLKDFVSKDLSGPEYMSSFLL
jgi:hypothetical protein